MNVEFYLSHPTALRHSISKKGKTLVFWLNLELDTAMETSKTKYVWELFRNIIGGMRGGGKKLDTDETRLARVVKTG